MSYKLVRVDQPWQKGYVYERSVAVGKSYHPEFHPDLTPPEMLALGVFNGRYFPEPVDEFPRSWFENAVLSDVPDPAVNCFGVEASLSLEEWQRKGWIHPEDPLGWFQWYCRYFMGRRMQDDERQIKRWRAMRRHVAQIQRNCSPGDCTCRPKQRQALLHWAYNSIVI